MKITWLLGANACAVEEVSQREAEVEDVMYKWNLEPVRLKGAESRTLYFLLQALVKQNWINLTLRHSGLARGQQFSAPEVCLQLKVPLDTLNYVSQWTQSVCYN